jgi:hypothetical protein
MDLLVFKNCVWCERVSGIVFQVTEPIRFNLESKSAVSGWPWFLTSADPWLPALSWQVSLVIIWPSV